MKTMIHIPLLSFLFLAASSPCFALMEIEDVSTIRAKELGVSFRTNMNGQAGTKVWMEFKAQGALKTFSYAELEIIEGNRHLVTAPLLATRTSPNQVAVQFSADPAWLPGSVLMIVAELADGGLGRVGYRFKVQEFIAPQPPPKKPTSRTMPTYVTADGIKAMPASRATLQDHGPCYGLFKNADGKQFVIGDPGSGPEVSQFLGTLEEGQTYDLPAAFLDYLKYSKKKKQ